MTVQNQALSSADGLLYSWVTAAPDWAASSFPGPGSALHIAVSMAPATPGSGGGVTAHGALTGLTDVAGHAWAELAQRPLASYTAASNDVALADVRKCIITTRGSAITLRIRLQASIAWLAETLLGGINTGAGTLTLTAEGGVTLNGSVSVPPHGWWWAKRVASNTWQCFTGGTGGTGSGDLKSDGTVPLIANWNLGGQAIIGGKSFSYANETPNSGATPAINFATGGDLHTLTLSTSHTPTFVAPLGIGWVQVFAIGDGTQRTITWPGSVVGTPPPPNVTGRTLYPFFYDGTSYHYSAEVAAYLRIDGTVAMTGDLNLGTHKVTGMLPGAVGTDGVNKSQLDAVAAAGSGKFGFQYTFATSTTDADPGAGLVRFNNAAPASVTQIYLDLVDVDGNTLTNWIASLDDALGAVKGFIYFRDIADDTKWGQYRLDSITSPGGYVKLNVTYIASGAGGLPSTTAAGTLLSFDAWGNGPAAGNGLTGTSTLAVLPEDSTITVGAAGVKRPAITGIVTIAAGSNASAIADGAIPRAKLAPETEYDNGVSGTADTISAANGTYQKSTLTGNCTYALTPPASGVFEIELRLVQGGTGSYTATFTGVIWPAGGPPRLSTVVGDEDFVVLSWKGTNWYGTTNEITLLDLPNIATASLLGRYNAGTGAVEVIALDDTLSVTGAGALQREALTGAVTAAAGSNTTAIAAGVIVAADINAAAAIQKTKLENSAACSFVGNPTNSTGPLADVALGTNGFVALRRSNALIGGLILNENIDPVASIAVTKIAGGTNGRVLVTVAGVPTWGTALGNTTDAMSINGVDVRLQAQGSNMLHAAILAGSRDVLGLFGIVSATEMPANTGWRVMHWHDASAMPTTGFPTNGGIIGCDEFLGLEWKGKYGVETTIAPHGDSGNTTKRRFVKFLTKPERVTIAPSATPRIFSFDCASLNGRAFVSGILEAKLHIMGTGEYSASAEWLVTVSVDGSSLASVVGSQPGSTPGLFSGSGFSFTGAFSGSGTTMGFDAVQSASFTSQLWGFWEINGFEI